MEKKTKVAAEGEAETSIVKHTLGLVSFVKRVFSTLLCNLGRPLWLVNDVILNHCIVEKLEKECKEHQNCASYHQRRESLLMAVKQLLSILHDLVFENEVYCKRKPKPKRPSEDELVQTVHSKEQT